MLLLLLVEVVVFVALLSELLISLNSEQEVLKGVTGADRLPSLPLLDGLGPLLMLLWAKLLLVLRAGFAVAEADSALRRVSLSWHWAAAQLVSRFVMLMEKSCRCMPC